MTEHPALTPLALALATLASLIAQVMRERHTAPPPPPPHAAPMQRRLEEIEKKTEALTRIMRQARTAQKKLTPLTPEGESEANKATSRGH